MRIKLILILYLFLSQVSYSQIKEDGPLIILDEKGFINSDESGQLYYLISIKSRDTLFDRDGYNFKIKNRRGVEEYGEKVLLDTLSYVNISEFSQFSNCDLHKFISLQKKIYVILKNEKTSIYWRYPIFYTGTQKNVEMLKM